MRFNLYHLVKVYVHARNHKIISAINDKSLSSSIPSKCIGSPAPMPVPSFQHFPKKFYSDLE